MDSRKKKWISEQTFCVTGGSGALGRALARYLISLGAPKIKIFDTRSSVELFAKSQDILECHTGNLNSIKDIETCLRGCTVVFHLAALIHTSQSLEDPIPYFETNTLGTARLLEVCRQSGVGRLIFTSTSLVYGCSNALPVGEDHSVSPASIYATSKAAAETVVRGFSGVYGMPCVIARLSNLYGASFESDSVAALALRQAIQGDSINLRELNSVRDFIHVDDVIEALVRLAMSELTSQDCHVVNVSTGRGISIGEMAQSLARVIELDQKRVVKLVRNEGAGQIDTSKIILDNTRLKNLTNWSPQIDLEEGFRRALKKFNNPRTRESLK